MEKEYGFGEGGLSTKLDWSNASKTVQDQMRMSKLTGTSYNKYGYREGFGSGMDSKIIQRELKKESENFGDGYVRLAMVDAQGGKCKNKPLNIGGKFYSPDIDGIFTIVDETFLDKMAGREIEKQETLKNIATKASVSDDVCMLALGFADTFEMNNWLGAGSTEGTASKNEDLAKIDATPEMLGTYAEGTLLEAQAKQKFKLVCKERMPIISKLTSQKAVNAE